MPATAPTLRGFIIGRRGCSRRPAGLHCLFSMASSMNCIAAVGVSRVCRGFVASSLVMFGGYRRRD